MRRRGWSAGSSCLFPTCARAVVPSSHLARCFCFRPLHTGLCCGLFFLYFSFSFCHICTAAAYYQARRFSLSSTRLGWQTQRAGGFSVLLLYTITTSSSSGRDGTRRWGMRVLPEVYQHQIMHGFCCASVRDGFEIHGTAFGAYGAPSELLGMRADACEKVAGGTIETFKRRPASYR